MSTALGPLQVTLKETVKVDRFHPDRSYPKYGGVVIFLSFLGLYSTFYLLRSAGKHLKCFSLYFLDPGSSSIHTLSSKLLLTSMKYNTWTRYTLAELNTCPLALRDCICVAVYAWSCIYLSPVSFFRSTDRLRDGWIYNGCLLFILSKKKIAHTVITTRTSKTRAN